MSQLTINIRDDLKDQFQAACYVEGANMSDTLRRLVLEFVIKTNPGASLRMCPECGHMIYHDNQTFEYCSHACAKLPRLPDNLLVQGAVAFSSTGAKGRINVYTSKTSSRKHCHDCGQQLDPRVALVAPPNRHFCHRCCVVSGYDYTEALKPLEFEKQGEILDFIKDGGTLDDG